VGPGRVRMRSSRDESGDDYTPRAQLKMVDTLIPAILLSGATTTSYDLGGRLYSKLIHAAEVKIGFYHSNRRVKGTAIHIMISFSE